MLLTKNTRAAIRDELEDIEAALLSDSAEDGQDAALLERHAELTSRLQNHHLAVAAQSFRVLGFAVVQLTLDGLRRLGLIDETSDIDEAEAKAVQEHVRSTIRSHIRITASTNQNFLKWLVQMVTRGAVEALASAVVSVAIAHINQQARLLPVLSAVPGLSFDTVDDVDIEPVLDRSPRRVPDFVSVVPLATLPGPSDKVLRALGRGPKAEG